jgi:hypothetical protein
LPNDLGDSEDFRTAEQTRYDALCDLLKRSMEQTERAETLILTLAESVQNGTHQTVIHKQEGMGAVGILCACVCVFCALFIILGAVMIVPEIHDLKAWQGQFGRELAAMKAIQQQKEGQK